MVWYSCVKLASGLACVYTVLSRGLLLFGLRPRTHGNVFLRFCIVSSNELVVLDSLENSKQYKKRRKTFLCVRGLRR